MPEGDSLGTSPDGKENRLWPGMSSWDEANFFPDNNKAVISISASVREISSTSLELPKSLG